MYKKNLRIKGLQDEKYAQSDDLQTQYGVIFFQRAKRTMKLLKTILNNYNYDAAYRERLKHALSILRKEGGEVIILLLSVT